MFSLWRLSADQTIHCLISKSLLIVCSSCRQKNRDKSRKMPQDAATVTYTTKRLTRNRNRERCRAAIGIYSPLDLPATSMRSVQEVQGAIEQPAAGLLGWTDN